MKRDLTTVITGPSASKMRRSDEDAKLLFVGHLMRLSDAGLIGRDTPDPIRAARKGIAVTGLQRLFKHRASRRLNLTANERCIHFKGSMYAPEGRSHSFMAVAFDQDGNRWEAPIGHIVNELWPESGSSFNSEERVREGIQLAYQHIFQHWPNLRWEPVK